MKWYNAEVDKNINCYITIRNLLKVDMTINCFRISKKITLYEFIKGQMSGYLLKTINFSINTIKVIFHDSIMSNIDDNIKIGRIDLYYDFKLLPTYNFNDVSEFKIPFTISFTTSDRVVYSYDLTIKAKLDKNDVIDIANSSITCEDIDGNQI